MSAPRRRLCVRVARVVGLVSACAVALVPVAHAGEWITTGSMAGPQRDLPATLLNNGNVLIVGFPTPELYDPVTGSFTATGSATVSNAHGVLHTATLLEDGRVLIVGGRFFGGVVSQVAHVYDPVTNTFAATASPQTARFAHTATRLLDGRILIAGGRTGDGTDTASAELYDPATGTFHTTGSLSTTRSSAAAALLGDGRVLIAGGLMLTIPGSGVGLSSAELYDPATGLFGTTGSMGVARAAPQATVLANGKVLITGGFLTDLAEAYDPDLGTFSNAGRMTTPRASHSSTLLSHGRVLIAGGHVGFVGSRPATDNSAEIYDPDSARFCATASMSVARQQHMAALLADGRVLVAGGFDGSRDVSSAEVFVRDPSANECPPVADAGPDQIVDRDSLVNLDGTRSSDPDGHPLTFRWQQSGGVAVALSDPSAPRPFFRAPFVDADMVLTFQLVVNNGTSDSASDTVNVTVRGGPPIANAGPDQRLDEGAMVVLNGTRSRSPNGGGLTFAWRQTAGPNVTLRDPASPRARFRAPFVSIDTVLTFELVLSQAGRTSAADSVSITVRNRGQSLYGTLSARGRPTVGAEIRLFRSRPLFRSQPVLRATTDPLGFWAFTGLQPGSYWIQLGGALQSVQILPRQDRRLDLAAR